MVSNFLLIIGMTMLLNASYSMLSYRRYIHLLGDTTLQFQVIDKESQVDVPIDVAVEVILGMLLGVFGAILKYSAQLNPINLNQVLGSTTKTYE